jgi:hypothetical protein
MYHLLSSIHLHHHMAHLPWEKPQRPQLHPLEVDKEDLPAENFGEPESS